MNEDINSLLQNSFGSFLCSNMLQEWTKLAEARVAEVRTLEAEKIRAIFEGEEKIRDNRKEKRARDAELKEQRRTEIYALNSILAEMSRRKFVEMFYSAQVADAGQFTALDNGDA